MSPLAQLLDRHRERLLAAPPVLWINPPADLPAGLLTPPARCFVQDQALFRSLSQRGFSPEFGAWPSAPERPGPVVFTLPREKARLRMMAHALASIAGADGSVLALGELRAGARSAGRHLEAFFRDVRKLDAARHCVLFEAREPRGAPATTTSGGAGAPAVHEDPGSFTPADYFRTWRLDGPAGPLDIHSLPGVFAHGALDAGTELLLGRLDRAALADTRRVLDLGCGAGVIGLVCNQVNPSIELVMADSNALALEATRATLAANEVSAVVAAADGLAGVEALARSPLGAPFDLVISNPPFHDGHRERDDRGAGVFSGIEGVLAPGGRLIIVVNRHLPWPRWLDVTFGGHEALASDGRFQVLCAVRSVQAAPRR